jgi:PAS domain S-box-containing protein
MADQERPKDLQVSLLEERIDHLEFLKSFNHEILSIMRGFSQAGGDSRLETCLGDVVKFVQGRLDIYCVNINLMDEATGEMVLFVSAGDPEVGRNERVFRIKPGEGLNGAAVAEGTTIVCNDVSKEPRFVRGPASQAAAELCIPIRAGEKVIGVFDLCDSRKGRFRKDLVETLEELAMNIGLLLENHRLYSELRTHSKELEQTVRAKVSQLRLSEQRYKVLIENIQDPIFIVDFDARLLWANASGRRFLDLRDEAPTVTNISHLVKKGHIFKLFQIFTKLRDGEVVRDIRLEMVLKTGVEKLVELTGTPIPEGSRIGSCEILLRDVTERVTVDRLKKNYLKTLEDEVTRRTEEIKDIQRASILALATLAESIDNFTYGHLQRMQQYARLIADELRTFPKYADTVTEEYVELIYDVSPLHDIGKVGIRDNILQKESRLTEEEFKKMKEHTEIGANALRMAGQLVRRDAIFAMAEMIARFHHQKWDGTGYPAVKIGEEFRPLRGDEIPLCARIVSLADVYDALTSRRPYKEPYPHEVAREMIVKDSGKHFDPDCVQAFLNRQRDAIRIKDEWSDRHTLIGDGKHSQFNFSVRDESAKGKVWAAIRVNGGDETSDAPKPELPQADPAVDPPPSKNPVPDPSNPVR